MIVLPKKKKVSTIIIALVLIAVCIAGIVMLPTPEKHETIKQTMKDAVLHDINKINFLGFEVDPSLISAFIVTGILFVFALIVRIFVIP